MATLGRVARLDVDEHVVHQHSCDLPVGVAQRAAERAQEIQRHTRLDVVHRLEHALEVGDLVLERRLGQFEIALLHGGAQDHVPPHSHERRLRAGLERRYLDNEVGLGLRAAGEAPACLQFLRRERPRIDRGDRLLAGGNPHLALLAGAMAAAGGVDRHAVPARAVEQRRAGRDTRLLDRAVGLFEDEPDPVRMDLVDHGLRLRRHAAAAACFAR